MQSVRKYSFGQDHRSSDLQTRLLTLVTEDEAYTLVQINGQRIFRKATDAWVGPEPSRNCEVFVGRIPHDCFEDTLVPLLMKAGDLFEFRLMINFSGWNRGYAFAMFTTNAEAMNAVRMLNNFMIRPSWQLGVCPSQNNCRLFISRIPPNLSAAQIVVIFYTETEGVKDVRLNVTALKTSTIVEYLNHRGAAMARKKLVSMSASVWGAGARPTVDWSLPDSPKLLRQYRQVGTWTPEHGVVLTRLDMASAPYDSSAVAGSSYTLEPWSQARRMRLIHEAQRASGSGQLLPAPITVVDNMSRRPSVVASHFHAAQGSLQTENAYSNANQTLLSDNGAKWSNRMVRAYEAGRVYGNGPANDVYYGNGGNGANWSGLGLAPAERQVWAPRAPAQFNPWTARLPVSLNSDADTFGGGY